MVAYTYSDLKDGDRVVIRGGKKKGQTGTIEMVTPLNYLIKLDSSGNFFTVKYGTMLSKHNEIKPETSLNLAILRTK